MEYVWYASYGSNVNRDRFLCYIQGGKPKKSQSVEIGCRDTSLPLDDRQILLPYSLYFAMYSGRWGGAPAFISHHPLDESLTLGRMYKITREQFLDVVKQENDGSDSSIDLSEVLKSGFQTFSPASWYGRIIHVGEEEGLPIFTFTAPWTIEQTTFSKPSVEYLSTIIEGLKQAYDWSNPAIVAYFLTKPGIKGNWSEVDLKQVVSAIG